LLLLASSSINDGNSLIVTTFRSELSHQLLTVVAALAILTLIWSLWRLSRVRRLVAEPSADQLEMADPPPEPIGRRILRIGFGILWIVDGLLQAQSSMPVGLGSQVAQPSASSSPGWIQHVVHSGVLVWNNHPVESAIAVVWIEIGIGVWLLVAPRGRWSQAGAAASVGWGLTVWLFGEALGGVFAPGLTFLTGAPGAALLYAVAGGLVALPERRWREPRIGRAVLVGMGVLFIGMGVLQAWPGRGFWQGTIDGHRAGPLAASIDALAGRSQPGFLSSWVSSFGAFDAAHGALVNLVAVVALVAIGTALCWGRGRALRLAVGATCIFSLIDWLFIQDLGFLGGLGTDPNTMIPIVLLTIGGFAAVQKASPVQVAEHAGGIRLEAAPASDAHRPPTPRLGGRPVGYALRAVAAGAAAAVVLLGAAPLAVAAANPTADPIITLANNGAPDVVNTPAPKFALVDQKGRAVSLANLRGKVLAITFLDPVCTTDCPLIAQEYRLADQELGASASQVEFIAIVANPLYRSRFYTNTFDQIEGLDRLPNWLFLTGGDSELHNLWAVYGAEVILFPAGAMVDHANVSYVIDQRGHIRYIMSADPGDDTSSSKSSFSGLLDQQIRSVLPTP
jgi:cytochrome oxidase Cu insertion factor (SCO1/SenC/PrrC family)